MNEQVAATHAESSLSGIQLAKRSIRAAGNLALAPREDREALSLMPHQRLLPSAEAPLRKERGRKAKLTPTISKALPGRGTYPPTSVLSGANVATPVFSVNCCATRGARVLCVFSACPSGLARKQGLEYPKLAGSAAICHVQVQGWGGGRSGLGPLNSPGPKTQS